MARFYWDNSATDQVISTKERAQITGSQEFLLCDPEQGDPVLYSYTLNILEQFSDQDILFKIKGNISKLLEIKHGNGKFIPISQLLRGLNALVSHADQLVTQRPWEEHDTLRNIAENMKHFQALIKNHDNVPADMLKKIGDVGLETVTYEKILKDIFKISNMTHPANAAPATTSKNQVHAADRAKIFEELASV